MLSIFKFTKKYLNEMMGILVIYIFLNIIIGASEMGIPYLIGNFIDDLVAGNVNIKVFSIILASLSILIIVLGYFSDRIYTILTLEPPYKMDRDAIYKVQSISILNELHSDSAYLNHRINNDSNMLIMFCVNVIQQLLVNSIKFIIPLVIFFLFDLYIGLFFLGLNGLYVLTYYALKSPLFKVNKEFSEASSRFFTKENEQIQNSAFLQMHGLNKNFINKLESPFLTLKHAGLRGQRIEYIFKSADKVLILIANISIFIWGGTRIMSAQMTVGEMTIILAYFNSMMSATQYFFTISGDIPEVKYFLSRMEEIFGSNEIAEGTEVPNAIQSIETQNLTFAYSENRNIISDYNYTFKKGNIYALKGHNGSGKSTFIKLLIGLYEGEMQGNVIYNATSIKNINMTKMREEKIAICEQEPFLLKDTILENITHGKNIPKIEINDCLEMLGLNSVIEKLENGLNTQIEEASSNLSGGEKQRIALTRTILKNADLVILDEPTSALDVNGKQRFLSFIKDYAKDRIIIISTHDANILEASSDVIRFGE